MTIPAGTVVERFCVEAFLGQGGAGAVYRVRHASLGLLRALKVIHLDVPELRVQLLEEGRIQARLQHPCLIRVHDAFEYNGDPALLLELVEGPSLQQVLSSTRLSPADAERLFLEILDGVAHAHEHGVIHRDLKPANVLLSIQDGVSHAKVGDFGIARLVDTDRPETTGPTGWLGTPAYMAPELLRGQRSHDPRLDIYALGVLLYRMISGHPPFPDTDPIRRLQAAEARAWIPLEQHAPDTPPRILRAVQGALEPDADRRIATVAGLREVLLGHVALRSPPLASPPEPPRALALPPPERAERASAMVPGAVMALVVLGGLLGWQSAERADSATRLEAARVALAAAEEPFPAAALALRRAAASLGSPGALAPAAVSRLLSRGAAVTMFPTQGEPVTSVGLGPSRVVSVDHSGLIEVFDRGSGARLAQIETDVEQVRWLTLSSDEHWVSVEGKGRITGSEQTGLAWSLPDGQPLVHAPSPPDRFATDRQDTVIASYTDVAQSVLGAWSVSGGNQLWSRISSEPISSLHVAAGVVAVSYVGGSFLLLDAQTGAVRREAMAGLRPLLSPDGRRAFLVQPGSGFQVLDLDSGAALASDPFAPEPVAAFGPGGDLSVVDQAGYGWWLPLSTAGGSVRRMSLTGRAAVVVAWPEGSLIGTREGRVLEARRGQVTHTAWLHHGRVTGLAADARGVLSGALDGSVIYQPHAGELLGLLEVRRTPGDARSVWGGAGGVAWQDDDGLAWEDDQGPGRDVGRLARLVSIGEDGQRTIFADDRVVSMRDGVSLRVPGETIDTRPIDLLMLDDGALLVTSGAVYRLWADQETRKIPLPVLKVSRLTPAGDLLLASFGKNTTVAVLETRTGQWIQTLSLPEAHQPGIAALSEVSGGEVFAGTWDGALIGWTLETGEARELAQLDAAVHIVAVSAARIAAASWDQHIRVWDRQAGTLLWDIFFPAGARTLLWLSGGDSLLVGTTEGDLYAFGHAGELRSVRAAVEGSAIERTWLREDGSIAVLSAAGDWQRWDPARLVEGYSSLSAAGALSNLRVCRDTLEVVPVVPFPDPGSAWAPDAACLPP